MAQDKELETKVKEETTASDVTVKNTEDNKPEAQKDENTLVYEEYEQHEVAAKPKRKFKKRYVVIGVALLLVAFIVFNSINSAKKAVVMVETKEASLGTIENILSISGTVQSAESKTYFSDVTAPLSEINVKVGDKVAAGDTLYTLSLIHI